MRHTLNFSKQLRSGMIVFVNMPTLSANANKCSLTTGEKVITLNTLSESSASGRTRAVVSVARH
jgi:hypothetical protein